MTHLLPGARLSSDSRSGRARARRGPGDPHVRPAPRAAEGDGARVHLRQPLHRLRGRSHGGASRCGAHRRTANPLPLGYRPVGEASGHPNRNSTIEKSSTNSSRPWSIRSWAMRRSIIAPSARLVGALFHEVDEFVERPHGLIGLLDLVGTVAVEVQLGERAERGAAAAVREIGDRADHRAVAIRAAPARPGRPTARS